MSDAAELYRALCRASNLDAAVARLSRERLADVAQYVSGLRPTGGVPAQIFGMISARLTAPARPKTNRRKTQDRT